MDQRLPVVDYRFSKLGLQALWGGMVIALAIAAPPGRATAQTRAECVPCDVGAAKANLLDAAAEGECHTARLGGRTLPVSAVAAQSGLQSLGWLFDTSNFPPRWQCGTWSASLGWTHIVSDMAIFAAYAVIPVALAFFILRRRDVPFLPIFWLFVAFILFCGFGHFVEACIFWHPWYRLSAVVKAGTAIVSWATVLALLPVLPKALALPGLATVNNRLAAEASERKTAEKQLQDSYDELHDFTRSVMDREDRMIELKREVNALLGELGRETRYQVEGTVG